MQLAAGRRTAYQAMCVVLGALIFVPHSRAGTNFDLQQAAGGLALTASGNNYRSTFGTVDALGINTGSAGMTRIALTNGTLYYTPYQIFVHNNGIPSGRHAYVTAYASTNFGHPAAVAVYNCPSNATCNASSAFAAMSTNVAAQTTVVATPGLLRGQTATVAIAVWVPDNDGPTAYTGTDNVVVTFQAIQFENGTTVETLQWQFNLAPAGVTIQTAVRLTLTTHTGGASVHATGGAPDYTLNFGSVNGLGIGPAAGLTVNAASGGVLYATFYDLNPAFADFPSISSTIKVYVSTDFAHPSILALEDSSSITGPFLPISKIAGGTTLTVNAPDRSTIPRALGLFVADTSGPSAFVGSDNATLTFTMTVP